MLSCHIEMLACFSIQFCFYDSVVKWLGLPLCEKPMTLGEIHSDTDSECQLTSNLYLVSALDVMNNALFV